MNQRQAKSRHCTEAPPCSESAENAETQTIKKGDTEGISGRRVQREEGGGPKTVRESYSLIVLRDGKADHMGKGWAGLCSLQRKHEPDKVGLENSCKPHCGE